MEWFHGLQDFHFLRPIWFMALVPALLAGFLIYRSQTDSGSWSKVISPELLPYLIDKPASGKRRNLSGLWLLGWSVAITALAGPTLERTPLPVHEQQSFLVIAFDLSPSMLAQDLSPNRLSRARLKLIDLLNTRQEGSTALIAYGGDAFVVSPLTDDAATIAAMVPALDPGILPDQGSNVEAAIEKAVELTLNTGQTSGDILLITDGISVQGGESLQVILRSMSGFRLFIMGIGTEQGAPIPLARGGFAKDAHNNILVPRLHNQYLRKLAEKNGGTYAALTADDSDIQFLKQQFETRSNHSTKQLDRTFDTWHDLGYWAILLLLPLLVLAFRKGLVACLLVSASLGLFPERTLAFEFQDLWLTKDQQAARALAEGDAVKAEQLFENQQWKGVAAYKNNNFSDAETLFDGNDADSHFNRGNALAKQGKLREAITAYEQALKLDPEMRDALDNIQAVKEEMKKQKEKEQQRNKENNQENNQAHSSAENQEGNQGQKNQSQDQGTRQEQEGNSQTSPEQTQDQQQSGNQSSQQTQQSSNSRNASGQQREQEQEQEKNTGQQPDKNRQSETPQDVPSGQSEGQQQEKQPNESANQSVPEELSDEEEQAVEQWLRRIPDDPGGLLRRKFEAEAQKRREQRRWGSMPPQDKQLQRW